MLLTSWNHEELTLDQQCALRQRAGLDPAGWEADQDPPFGWADLVRERRTVAPRRAVSWPFTTSR